MGCEPTINDWCCTGTCPPDLTDVEKQAALDAALETVSHLISPRFVRCETHVFRPCLPNCGCTNICGCAESTRITVPFPLLSGEQILATWVDGVRTVAGMWRTRIDGNHTIISPVDIGSGRFTPPARQNLDLAYTQSGTWGIEIATSSVPPLVAQLILGIACEIGSWCRTGKCDLPAGTVSITEQGVTVTLDRTQLFSDSRVPILREIGSIIQVYGVLPVAYAGLLDMETHGVWDQLI